MPETVISCIIKDSTVHTAQKAHCGIAGVFSVVGKVPDVAIESLRSGKLLIATTLALFLVLIFSCVTLFITF